MSHFWPDLVYLLVFTVFASIVKILIVAYFISIRSPHPQSVVEKRLVMTACWPGDHCVTGDHESLEVLLDQELSKKAEKRQLGEEQEVRQRRPL